MPTTLADPPEAHVLLAHKIFRDCGFDLDAMQYKRPPEALAALKAFNGLPPDAKVPFGWGYFPNPHMRGNWERYYLAKQEPGHDAD